MSVERADPVPVLYFTGGIRIGGMETHLLHLVERLDRSRFAPHICCLFPSDEYRARIDALDVPQTALDIPYLSSPGRILRLRRFLSVLSRVRPRIVQTYGYTCDVVGPPLARMHRSGRVITTRRGEDRSPRHQRMRSFVNNFTDAVVCVSEETRRFTLQTESMGRARTVVIPNGVLVPEISRIPATRLRFGTLGTVKEIKGTDLLVDAFLRFPPDVNAELLIGGRTDRSSAFSAAVADRAADSPLADRVRFVGYQSDADDFYAGVDVFVLPSRSEGMSNALLEAMAAGLPCVATDVGSNRSVLHHSDGRRGGLITETSAASIHAAMATMLDPGERARAARDARSIIADGYEMAHMVHAHEDLYASLLGASVGR